MEQKITWEIEKQECGYIAEIIRYADEVKIWKSL